MRQCNMNYYQQRTIGKVHYGKKHFNTSMSLFEIVYKCIYLLLQTVEYIEL